MGFREFFPLVSNQLREVGQRQVCSLKVVSAHHILISLRRLTGVLLPERGSSVIVVEHIGGEGPLELISVGVLDHLLFGFLLLLFLGCGFSRAATCIRGRCNSRLLLL